MTTEQSNLGRWVDNVVAVNPSFVPIRVALENEMLAMGALNVLHECKLLHDDAVFIGGTALRLAHNSPRFSEDLDFHIPPNVPRDIDDVALTNHLSALVGGVVHATKPTAQGRSKLLTLSVALPERAKDVRRPRTKIDLGVRRQLDASPTIVLFKMAGGVAGMGDLADPQTMLVSSKEELLADKHMALVGRGRRIKQRDLFDIMWLHHQGVGFNADLLAAKLAEARIDGHAFTGTLRQRAEDGKSAILSGDYRAEMSRFLPHDSSWLFDESHATQMAGGFKTLVLDHARMLDGVLNRFVARNMPTHGHGIDR